MRQEGRLGSRLERSKTVTLGQSRTADEIKMLAGPELSLVTVILHKLTMMVIKMMTGDKFTLTVTSKSKRPIREGIKLMHGEGRST